MSAASFVNDYKNLSVRDLANKYSADFVDEDGQPISENALDDDTNWAKTFQEDTKNNKTFSIRMYLHHIQLELRKSQFQISRDQELIVGRSHFLSHRVSMDTLYVRRMVKETSTSMETQFGMCRKHRTKLLMETSSM